MFNLDYKINLVNSKKDFTLILGGGPGINTIGKYSEKFEKVNYIMFNYNKDFNLEEQVSYIIKIIEKENLKITKYIGFSFGTYIGNFLIQKIKTIKEVHYIGFLYLYKQLKSVYSKNTLDILKEFKDKGNILSNSLYKFIEENITLAGYTFKREDITMQELKETVLQLKYESKEYFETYNLKFNSKRFSKIKFNFYTGDFDKLTPSTNIDEFLFFCNVNYTIEKLETGHSFSSFIPIILEKIK